MIRASLNSVKIALLQFFLRLHLAVCRDPDDHGGVLHPLQAPRHGLHAAPRLPHCEPRHRPLLDSPQQKSQIICSQYDQKMFCRLNTFNIE